jgi:hypothetical protein
MSFRNMGFQRNCDVAYRRTRFPPLEVPDISNMLAAETTERRMVGRLMGNELERM